MEIMRREFPLIHATFMNWYLKKSLNLKYKRKAEYHVSSANQLLPSSSEGGVVNPQMDCRLKQFVCWARKSRVSCLKHKEFEFQLTQQLPINLPCSLPFRLSTFVPKPLLSIQGNSWASTMFLLQMNFHAVNES
jgi:hypothetical protein